MQEQFVHSIGAIFGTDCSAMTGKNKALAERLPALIEASEKSQGKVADEIGIGRRTFNNYCKGRVPKDERELEKIATFFGTSKAYLLGYTSDPAPTGPSPISTNGVQKPLTPSSQNGGRHHKEETTVDSELYRSLVLLGNEMAAMRQDLRQLSERVSAVESGGRVGPQKGRKGK